MDAQVPNLVWDRAGSICEYCRVPQHVDRLRFQIDHVLAKQHVDDDSPDNLALACFACNNHKGTNLAGIDPETGAIVRLFHPRTDVWEEHFTWRNAELVGQTAIGRVTVRVLAINLPHRIDLRKSLIDEGELPPS